MKSMTGFGAAETSREGYLIRVEASSINRKGLDVVVSLPRDLQGLETELRQLVQKRLSRGRVSLYVAVSKDKQASPPSLKVNEKVLSQHYRKLKGIARKLGCGDEMSLSFLLTLPGVMEAQEEQPFSPAFEKAVVSTVSQSLNALIHFRAREGRYLSRQLTAQVRALGKCVKAIERANPKLVRTYRKNLHQRMKDSGLDISLNDDRILRETALYADRCDVSEEVTRLNAHLHEMEKLLLGDETAGRKLDFILQETNREVNTIGSKAAGLEISKQVIALKTELEKIREQVQNLE